ncbi:tetratricopeptide repeat protein [Streptomyces sp. NPDC005492]|uniref:tetratricopeptide repeat protein n=1 Tax=Streptomyces sp. NPDC005492 TaxID=3156883 RepID=UPI0033A930BD
MIKAFFSYSTKDADFVREVASKVGRAFARIDFRSFAAGGDILESIDEALKESAAFVFFLSKAALESPWVAHEIREARFQAAIGRIKNTLVVRLDDRISQEDLPDWLNRSKYITATAAKPVAREIGTLIDDLVRQGQSPRFVGRANEIAALQDAYSSPGPGAEAQIACVTGLSGIGRKSALTKMVRESLDLERLLVTDLEPGDTVQTLAMKLCAQVDPSETPEESLQRTKEIAALDSHVALALVLSKLREICAYREMPVLNDASGLMDNDGDMAPFVLDLIEALGKYPEIVIALLTHRRPTRQPFTARGMVQPTVVHLRPLDNSDINRLVALAARARQMSLTAPTVKKITSAVRGYPPSVTYALELVEAYGADLGASDRVLSTVGAGLFTRYLKDNQFSGLEMRILRVMNANSPLPLAVLRKVIDATDGELETALTRLIDVSLIVPTTGGWYEVSGPAADTIRDVFGQCTRADYAAVASGLDAFLAQRDDGTDFLALQRTLFRAFNNAGRASTSRAYALVTDHVQLAEQYYHEQRYERAVQLASEALEVDPTIHQARTTLIRSLVKLSEYDDAQENIAELKKRGQIRDAFFLLGFLERNRGDHRQALRHYQQALDHGRGGMAIHRDMADCYLRLGDLKRAEEHISTAEEKQPYNRYVVDLKIQIACKLGDEKTARELLRRLADIDRQEMVSHRQSRVEYLFGHLDWAYEFAEQAVAQSENIRFEVLANYAQCALRTSHVSEAREALNQLDQAFHRQRRDIRTGLRARLCIAEQDYETALDYATKFVSPERPVHLQIRQDAVRGLLERTALSNQRRAELKAELRHCEERLAGQDGDFDLDALTGAD